MLQLRLDEFTWERPTSRRQGFCWERADGDLCLARVSGATFKPYQPDPGLGRDFADLQRTPDAALKFANRYGALHQRLEVNSFSFWRKGIEYVRRLVTEALKAWPRIEVKTLGITRHRHARGQESATLRLVALRAPLTSWR